MTDFLMIKSLGEDEETRILAEIEKRIAAKKAAGLLQDKEIREIEEMKLRPLPDIQDVQSVYENHLFTREK
jgi:hypothetical protein